jgi:hypothetical protein
MREEKQMSMTTISAPAGTIRSAATTARLALVAVAVVALLALSFVVGRVTADSTSSHTSSIVPAAHTSAGVDDCPRFKFC